MTFLSFNRESMKNYRALERLMSLTKETRKSATVVPDVFRAWLTLLYNSLGSVYKELLIATHMLTSFNSSDRAFTTSCNNA